VCLPAIISSELHVILGICYLWPFRLGPPLAAYSDVLRISGFMDDVIFAHKVRLLDIAPRLRQPGGARAGGGGPGVRTPPSHGQDDL